VSGLSSWTTSDESIASSISQNSDLTDGSLDALLNNAGAGYSMPLMDLDIAEARKPFDLNVFSLIRVTHAFFPLLVKSTLGEMVVNNTACSSAAFCRGSNASKAAAASITEVLRLEFGPFCIEVINLMMGSV
ncbi:hypothetical protein BGW36DRAFT_267892, partial [Talaromyces proteolyticus]